MASTRSGLQGVPIYGTDEILFPIQIIGVDLCSCSVRSTESPVTVSIYCHLSPGIESPASGRVHPIPDR